jgi:hypothetical protein
MYGSGNYEFWIDAVCQGAECSATNLTPCTSDSNSDGTCNATTGHCNVASCAGLNTLTATPLTPNCTPGSGRSTFDNGSTVPGGICISDYTATPAVFRRLFYADPATACGPGLRAHWSLFTYNYNSGDGPIPKGTNITFDFRTGSDAVSVYTNPAVTVSIAGYSVTTSAASATAVQLGPTYCTNTSGAWPTSPTPCPGGDVTCPVACPIDVGAALHNGTTSPLVLPQQPYLPYLLMEATFNPNSGDFSNTPVLSSWDVTYDCEADM